MNGKNNSPYDDLLGAIPKAWLLIRQKAKNRLKELDYDLTFEQLIVLHILKESEGLNLGEVAERADRERTTMSRMIDGLEKRNLVVRVPDKIDRRQKMLYLNNLGKEKLAGMDSLRVDFAKVIYAGIDQSEIERVLATMVKIMKNLEQQR